MLYNVFSLEHHYPRPLLSWSMHFHCSCIVHCIPPSYRRCVPNAIYTFCCWLGRRGSSRRTGSFCPINYRTFGFRSHVAQGNARRRRRRILPCWCREFKFRLKTSRNSPNFCTCFIHDSWLIFIPWTSTIFHRFCRLHCPWMSLTWRFGWRWPMCTCWEAAIIVSQPIWWLLNS